MEKTEISNPQQCDAPIGPRSFDELFRLALSYKLPAGLDIPRLKRHLDCIARIAQHDKIPLWEALEKYFTISKDSEAKKPAPTLDLPDKALAESITALLTALAQIPACTPWIKTFLAAKTKFGQNTICYAFEYDRKPMKVLIINFLTQLQNKKQHDDWIKTYLAMPCNEGANAIYWAICKPYQTHLFKATPKEERDETHAVQVIEIVQRLIQNKRHMPWFKQTMCAPIGDMGNSQDLDEAPHCYTDCDTILKQALYQHSFDAANCLVKVFLQLMVTPEHMHWVIAEDKKIGGDLMDALTDSETYTPLLFTVLQRLLKLIDSKTVSEIAYELVLTMVQRSSTNFHLVWRIFSAHLLTHPSFAQRVLATPLLETLLIESIGDYTDLDKFKQIMDTLEALYKFPQHQSRIKTYYYGPIYRYHTDGSVCHKYNGMLDYARIVQKEYAVGYEYAVKRGDASESAYYQALIPEHNRILESILQSQFYSPNIPAQALRPSVKLR